MKELEYPFDSSFLLKKRRKLKKSLLADGSQRMEKRIAVLGGSTTNDIISMLELFLLNCGIQPAFYQSEYAQYWQNAMFDNPELESFQMGILHIDFPLQPLMHRCPFLHRSRRSGMHWSASSATSARCGNVCTKSITVPLSRTTLNCRPPGSWETGMPGTVTAWSGLSRN